MKFTLQLLRKVDSLPSKGKWLYELKHDGWRIAASVLGGNVNLVSRNDNDFTLKFGTVTKAIESWASEREFILDGEMITIQGNHVYMVFDILFLDGKDLRDEPLINRKKILEGLFVTNPPNNIRLCQFIEKVDKDTLAKVCSGGHEGMVAKLADSTYNGKRDGRWVKIKCF